MLSTETQRDEFASNEFVDTNAALPSVTVLNDQLHCGYFIPVNAMARCGWHDFDADHLITHTFRSGNQEQGILIQNPRMLVVPKSDLYMVDKEASQEQGGKVIFGLFDSTIYDPQRYRVERIYLVFFLDKDNQPLHTTPLKYIAHGVNGTTFTQERSRFKSELEACHALANSIPARPKNEKFHALGVFAFKTEAQLVGDKQKAWCCRVVAHEKPSLENWKDYFLGYTQLKDYFWEALEPEQKIDVLSIKAIAPSSEPVAALPASQEDDVPW